VTANILFLADRLPRPHYEGYKARSFHLLKHLARVHRIFLGTFIDNPEDEAHLEVVRPLCASLRIIRRRSRLAKIRSLGGLLAGESLTLRYYRDNDLQDWIDETCQRRHIDAAVITSSAMAQYVEHLTRLRTLIDFVDVDSAKWIQYASHRRWPLSWLYQREGRLLLAYERKMAAQAARSFFVTENKAILFRNRAPECAVRVEALGNGVDASYFAPDLQRPSPYPTGEIPIVFIGAMRCSADLKAITWFTTTVLPDLLRHHPNIHLYIIGRSPIPEVLALTNDGITVTGSVPDERPWLQYATAVVAPSYSSRSIHNDILEAMAMSRPVVTSAECAVAIDAVFGKELLIATLPDDYVAAIQKIIHDPETAILIGEAARRRVVENHNWGAKLIGIDRYLPGAGVSSE